MNNTFSDSSQIGMVSTFSELVQTDFKGEMNALCWYRNLDGDFNEIVSHPKQQELACIHRTPIENEGEYRLLLIC
jgi:hypothetical protein